ncbi:MAG: GtrA family protein [Anaerolineae bacterium]
MTAAIQTWIGSNRKELDRFLKFAVVGTIGAVVDFGLLYLLHPVLGLHLALANTISFTCAVLSNFTWNRYWTYPDSRSKPLTAQLGQFFIVNLAGWGINTGVLLLFSPPLTRIAESLLFGTAALTSPGMGHKIGYNLAKVVATGIVMFWNFFINRFWTYNDVE